MSALPDDDAKASTNTKTEITLNESDSEMPIHAASKYPAVVWPLNEVPEQKTDLAELMTSLAATYNCPDSDKLVLVDQKTRWEMLCAQ